MSLFPAGSVVAVTGANGYIGTHIVKLLLAKQYNVRAVVRDPTNEEKVGHLRSLPHSDRLQLVKGELNETDYQKAFAGAQAVIHVATPYMYTAPDADRDIVQPAVAGTLAALRAALGNGVKRIVVTSSGGAFLHFPVPDGYKFSVTDWNSNASLTNNPYFLSKRRAEEAAWQFARDHPALQVTVVNPLYVLGPSLSGTNLNQSLANIKRVLMAEPGVHSLPHIGVVDVRDVAAAHVLALEHPAAAGQRLFCASRVLHFNELVDTLRRLFPQYPVGSAPAPPTAPPATWSIDTQPLAALGHAHYIEFEPMLRDTVLSLVQHKVVPQL